MEIKYDLKINKKIYSNLSFNQISKWILQNKVNENCSVYRSGFSGYYKIDQVEEFKEVLEKYKVNLRGLTNILIVEDDKLNRETLKEILSERNFKVVDTASAYEALVKVKEYDFHLAFIDIKMPGMNGVELLQMFKRLKLDFKIIIMTGFTLPDLEKEALGLGVEFILRKPFSINKVYEAVEHLLARRH